jgi:transposase
MQRRRRWSRGEKERIVAAALEPGVVASEVAREAGIHTSQLFRWRQELCKRAPAPVAFNPVAVAPVPEATSLPLPAPSPEQAGTVEIEFATGGPQRSVRSGDRAQTL